MVTSGVLCGHGSVIGGCFPCGAQSVFWGRDVESSFSSCQLPAAFPQSLGCVLCLAAGQQLCCFRLSGCFLYPLCSCHTLTGGARHGGSTLCGPPLI